MGGDAGRRILDLALSEAGSDSWERQGQGE